MEFSTFLLPLITKCREKFGEWSLMLEMESLHIAVDEFSKVGDACLAEREACLQIKSSDKILTAKSKEVRFKVSEPCCLLSKHLSSLVLCNHKYKLRSHDIENVLTFCNNDHSKTVAKLKMRSNEDVSDSILVKILAQVFNYHMQSTEQICINSIEKVCFPMVAPNDVYVVCNTNSKLFYTIQVFDETGWKICDINGIRLSETNVEGHSQVHALTRNILSNSVGGSTADNKKSSNFCNETDKSTSNHLSISSTRENSSKSPYSTSHCSNFHCYTSEENASKTEAKIKRIKDENKLTRKNQISQANLPARTFLKKNGDEAIRKKIRDILSSYVNDEIDDDLSFTRLGLDSFQLGSFEMELKRQLKDHFNVKEGCVFENNTISLMTNFLLRNRLTANPDRSRTTLERIVKSNQPIPLSKSQERLVFMAKFDKENEPQFYECFSVEFRHFDLPRLRYAMNRMIARQNVLRTTYAVDCQIVLSLTESFVYLYPEVKPQKLPFIDIFQKPPILFYLQKTNICHKLTVTMHHIMTDGMSMNIFAYEAQHLYERKRLSKITGSFAEFAINELATLENPEYLKPREDYWRSIFTNSNMQQIPVDKPRRADLSHQGHYVRIQLRNTTIQKLINFKENCDVTLFSSLVGIFYILMNAMYNIEDFCIGMPVAQRNASKTHLLMGCFVNLVPIVANVKRTEPVKNFMRYISEKICKAVSRQLPFNDLIKMINSENYLKTSAPFQVMLVIDSYYNEFLPTFESIALTLKKENTGFVKYDQTWYFECHDKLPSAVFVEYNCNLLHKETVVMLVNKFLKLIDELDLHVGDRIQDLDLEGSIEKLLCYRRRFEKTCDFPSNKTAMQLIDEQRNRKVYYNCLMHKDLNYSSIYLGNKASRIAKYLQGEFIKYYGEFFKSDDIAALLVQRTPDMIAIILGIWACGLAVAPISVNWPNNMITAAINQLNFPPIFTLNRFLDVVKTNCLTIMCDSETKFPNKVTNNLQRRRQIPCNLAYITFTSGTTGKPKGVCTDFIGMNNLIMCYTETLAISTNSLVYQVVNNAFDIFFADLLEALTNGAKLLLAEERIPRNSELSLVSHAYIMPVYLAYFDDEKFCSLQNLSKLQFGGEPVQVGFLQKAIDGGITVFQQYGLTEHTVYSTLHRMKAGEDHQIIGNSIKNTFLNVEKQYHGRCSVYGVGLSRGYFNNDEANKIAFKINKNETAEDKNLRNLHHHFLTEDRLTFDAHGCAKFCGRFDRIVKVRGMTVNLAEIESCISAQQYVQTCCAVITGSEKSISIAACITLNRTISSYSKTDMSKLIEKELSKQLPYFMLPSEILILQEIPTTSNGKIDISQIKQLLELENQRRKKLKYSLSKMNKDDEKIYKLFHEILNRTDLSPNESFFENGGDSLKALMLQQKIEEAFSVKLDIGNIFYSQKIADIIENIENMQRLMGNRSKQKPQLRCIKKVPFDLHIKRIPLSFQQRGLFLMEQLSKDVNDSYVIQLQVEFNQELSSKSALDLIHSIIMKHSALRTHIKTTAGEAEQSVLSGTEAYFSVYNNDQRMAKSLSKLNHYVPLNIKAVPKKGKWYILFRIHHILIDGCSLEIIKTDLFSKYMNSIQQPQNNIKRQNHSADFNYFIFSLQQREDEKNLLEQSKDWIKTSPTAEPLKLPYDFPDNIGSSQQAAHIVTPLNIQTSSIRQFCKEYHCSTFAVLLAAYAVLMRDMSGFRRFTVGIPVANRSLNTDNTVGFFTNTVILQLNADFQKTSELINSVQDSILQSIKHQHIPFELFIRSLNPKREGIQFPYLHHSVVMHEVPHVSKMKEGNLEAKFKEVPSRFAKFEQTWSFAWNDKNIILSIEYCRSLFSRHRIEYEATFFKKIVSTLLKHNEIPTLSVPKTLTDFKSVFSLDTKLNSQIKCSLEKHGTIGAAANPRFPSTSPNNVSQEKQKLSIEAKLHEQIQEIWQDILHIPISLDDNFFSIGGHSLHAAKTCFQITNRMNYNCPLQLLFENQTVRLLARALLDNQSKNVYLHKSDIHKENNFTTLTCDLQQPILDLYLNQSNALLAYNTGFSALVDDLNISHLQRCLNSILMTYSALRTSFEVRDYKFRTIVHSGTESFICVIDSNKKINSFLNPLERIPIASWVENYKNKWCYKLSLSHVIADQRSLRIIANDFTHLYYRDNIKRKRVMEYPEFSEWFQNQLLLNKDKCETYWMDKLKNVIIENLTISKTTPTLYDYRCNYLNIRFSSLNRVVKELTKKYNVSGFAVMLMAFAKTLLQRMLGDRKVVIACPFSMRTPATKQTVGFFLNTLPLVIELNENNSDSTTLQNVFKTLQEAYDNSTISNNFINEECLKGQKPKAMITLEDNDDDENPDYWTIKEDGENCGYTKYEITFFLRLHEDDVELKIEYMKVLFDSEIVNEIANEWAKRISNMITMVNLKVPCNKLEKHDFPKTAIPQLIENAAKVTIWKSALLNKKRVLTYNMFLSAVHKTSQALLQSVICHRGEFLRSDLIVPIIQVKTLDTIIFCLAIMYSGVSYLPLDDRNPKKRISKILHKINADFYIAVTDLNLAGLTPVIINSGQQSSKFSHRKFRHRSGFNDIAYTIYTSGTTGEPKGVVIEQGSVVNLAVQSTKNFFMSPSDCVYQLTNYCFDNSVLEIVMALTNGSRLLIKEDPFVPSLFVEEMKQYKITHALLFPSLVEIFDQQELQELQNLRYWIVGAEKASEKTLFESLSNGIKVIQNYGPTETTAYALYKYMHVCDHPNNLGKPICNVNILISTHSLEPAPNFAINELSLQGVNIMRGYIGRDSETDNRQKQAMTTYASGDLVRKLPNGDIIFIGRNDQQVKLRGFRIELTEIEAILLMAPEVKQAKVIMIKQAEKCLFAFLVPKSLSTSFSITDIKNFCKEHLPYYMVPGHFCQIDALPLTKNAKVDTRYLENLLISKYNVTQFEESRTSTESELLEVFRNTLKDKNISVVDDFFFIGGNSLLARKLIERIKSSFRVQISMADFFENKTVRKLASLIESRISVPQNDNNKNHDDHLKDSWQEDKAKLPLSYEQQQVYYLNNTKQAGYYNLIFSQNFPISINFKHLCHSFHRLILKQQSMRTIFKEVAYDVYQFLLSGTETYFYPKFAASEKKLKEIMDELSGRSLELSVAPPLICVLYKNESTITIRILINHIISDAWSTRLMETELNNLYLTQPGSAIWKDVLKYTYIDYALQQHKAESRKQLEQQCMLFAKELELNVITSKSIWPVNTESLSVLYEYEHNDGIIDKMNYKNLLNACSIFSCSPSIIFLGALTLAIHTQTNISKLIIGVIAANRNYHTANVIGNFLNTLLVASSFERHTVGCLIQYLDQLKKSFELAHQYETVPLLPLITTIRKLTKKKFIPEIIYNCRYDLEDGATSQISFPNVLTMNKCAHAVEMDVDLVDEQYTWQIRIHKDAHPALKKEQFAAIFESTLLKLLQLAKTNEMVIPSNFFRATEAPQKNNKTFALNPAKSRKIREELKRIWGQCLQSESVLESDDFFFIGGNSLSCLKLQRLIKNAFHFDVPLEKLINSSSFRAMHELIEQNTELDKRVTAAAPYTLPNESLINKTVISLNFKKQQDRVIILVHPLIGGVIFPYTHLIKELLKLDDTLVLLGLQHPNTFNDYHTDLQFNSSIEELCTAYVEALIPYIGKSKCAFVGASLGGILSYECANQFKNKGIIADKLILIDSAANSTSSPSITFEQHKDQVLEIISLFAGASEFDNHIKQSVIKNSWKLLQMREIYKPKPNFQLRASLLKLKEENGDYGWGSLCNVKIIPIEGTHTTMLNSSHSVSISRIIYNILKENE